ncbi:aminoglycoside phosphotransferase family protein [Streptomyces niveiscabiei]|uniref:phosphotransferase family protein n=1 Tax=Streptomyces niveiscabiei TaxID=164115 RepID=UPI0029AE5417|nr:aminoglycoside phosphotransferase family protein [Streptomyces niveiscabiei]MDX3383339.1 aminoglycoside phosphotransferase family protein [Streptomyces niveiscabiei]
MSVRSSSLAWVKQCLEPGEEIVGVEVLYGGISAQTRRLAIRTRGGGTRELVLRTGVRHEDEVRREAGTLALLAGTGVPAPVLVAADAGAGALLMTYLPGRTCLDDEGVAERVPLLARQLVGIHALEPDERPPAYTTRTTAESVVIPPGADTATWAAAIDVIREPAPPYEGRFLHRDFHPGNVLFGVPLRITGVVDWATASWGPAGLDVARCATNLALLHGPEWGRRFVEAYEEAGGRLGRRLYWLVRDALALSEEVRAVARAWREAGRAELTARVVEERLDAYVGRLMGGQERADQWSGLKSS